MVRYKFEMMVIDPSLQPVEELRLIMGDDLNIDGNDWGITQYPKLVDVDYRPSHWCEFYEVEVEVKRPLTNEQLMILGVEE